MGSSLPRVRQVCYGQLTDVGVGGERASERVVRGGRQSVGVGFTSRALAIIDPSS